MATGKAPFEGDTPAMVFDQLLNRQPRSPLILNPMLPGLLTMVIERALEKDPDARYRSADDFLEDLESIDSSKTATRAMSVQADGRSRLPRSSSSLSWI